MQKFKNILVAVDTDADSRLLLERAADLAHRNNGRLKLVDVVREFGWLERIALPTYHQIKDRLIADKARTLEELAAELRGGELEITTNVLVGRSSVEIIREVLRDGHDLVMKEAKGPQGLKGFFGTTGMQLFRKCPCPVWMTKPGPHAKYERVLAAVDVACHDEVHQRLNTRILEVATSFSQLENSRLDVVCVWDIYGASVLKSHMSKSEFDAMIDSQKSYVEKCADQVLRPWQLDHASAQVHLPRGEPHRLIPELIQYEQIDLIVMGTVARGGVAGALMGNTAEAILDKVQCSVLAIKPEGFVSPVR